MKIACVFISHFRGKAEIKRNPDLAQCPGVIVDRLKPKPLVLDRTPAASRVTTGMSLTDAISRHADTIIIDSDEPYYNRLDDQIIDALLEKCDRVERAGLGCYYLRIDGLETLYGGEARLVAALLDVVLPGFNPRVGVGPSKFPAFVAALHSDANSASRTPDDAASFLKPFSIDLLPVSPEAKARLWRFGLRTLGQVAELTIGELQDEFGLEGRLIWELCNGIDRSPFVPLRRKEAITEYMSLPDWAVCMEFFLVALDSLAKRAYSRPEMRNIYVGKAMIECATYNGPAWSKAIALKESAGSSDLLMSAVKANVDISEMPGLPLDVELSLSEFTGERVQSQGLFSDAQEHERRRALIQSVDRKLRIRIGAESVLKRAVEAIPKHPLPELRSVLVSIDPNAPPSLEPLREPDPVDVRAFRGDSPRVLYKGKKRIEVARVKDLWKINIWWTPKPAFRTYYELEGRDGGIITVFRDNHVNAWYQQSY